MESKGIKMASPWVNYYRQIDALFGKDPEIKVSFNEETNVIRLLVDNSDKAAALEKLLPAEKTFGGVTVYVNVVPANQGEKDRAALIRTAFKGNPAFRYAKTVDVFLTNPINYIVFKKKVVQYPIDDLHDVHGNCSTLYQEIAKEVIGEDDGIFFCTDNLDGIDTFEF